MEGDEKGLNIDVGIITIKPEEFSAVTSRLGKWSKIKKDQHHYICNTISDINDIKYDIAVARCLEPGTGTAQSLAADMIKELNPTWIFLVGIAGGFPASEYSLGDVLLCTRLHDFSICCINEDDHLLEFADFGGPIHPEAAKLLEVLPAYENHLEANGWNELSRLNRARPVIDICSSLFYEKLYGDEDWKGKVVKSLEANFSKDRKPKYCFGSTGSSDRLVKSPSLAKIWQISARDLKLVEMELAGVYRAAYKENIPVLAIRSLSDIVGYKRSPEWTEFACESAASFAISIIEAGLLTKSKSTDKRPKSYVNEQGKIESISIKIKDSIMVNSTLFGTKEDKNAVELTSDFEEAKKSLELIRQLKSIKRENVAGNQRIQNEAKTKESRIWLTESENYAAKARREGELEAFDIARTLVKLRRECVDGEAFAVRGTVDILKNKLKAEKSLDYRLGNISKMLDIVYNDPFRKLEETHRTRILELCNYIEEAYPAFLTHVDKQRALEEE